MAARKRRRSSKKKGAHCKVVTIKGQGRRRLCWGANGKIKSNTKVRKKR